MPNAAKDDKWNVSGDAMSTKNTEWPFMCPIRLYAFPLKQVVQKIVLLSNSLQKSRRKIKIAKIFPLNKRQKFYPKRSPSGVFGFPLKKLLMVGFSLKFCFENARKMFSGSGNSIAIIIHVMLLCCLFDFFFCFPEDFPPFNKFFERKTTIFSAIFPSTVLGYW